MDDRERQLEKKIEMLRKEFLDKLDRITKEHNHQKNNEEIILLSNQDKRTEGFYDKHDSTDGFYEQEQHNEPRVHPAISKYTDLIDELPKGLYDKTYSVVTGDESFKLSKFLNITDKDDFNEYFEECLEITIEECIFSEYGVYFFENIMPYDLETLLDTLDFLTIESLFSIDGFLELFINKYIESFDLDNEYIQRTCAQFCFDYEEFIQFIIVDYCLDNGHMMDCDIEHIFELHPEKLFEYIDSLDIINNSDDLETLFSLMESSSSYEKHRVANNEKSDILSILEAHNNNGNLFDFVAINSDFILTYIYKEDIFDMLF